MEFIKEEKLKKITEDLKSALSQYIGAPVSPSKMAEMMETVNKEMADWAITEFQIGRAHV